MAFYNEYFRLFRVLLPSDDVFWNAFQEISLLALEANAREKRHRFRHFAEITDDMLDFGRPENLAERAAPLCLSTIAQLRCLGHLPDDQVYGDLLEIVRAYSIVNQIADDDEDLVCDLRAGRLSALSAFILWRMRETDAISAYDELSVERIVAYYLTHDTLLDEVHEFERRYIERALALAGLYPGKYMIAFLSDVRDSLEADHRRLAQTRGALRDLFGLAVGCSYVAH